MARRKEPKIADAVTDQLLAEADPKTTFDPIELLRQPLQNPAERGVTAR
jgi:putative transposase